MTGYILNDRKTFEIFVRAEKILDSNLFPVMKKFQREEIEQWIQTAEKFAGKNGKIIDIGCGSGRILKALLKKGFNATGFDNDPLLVEYCKKKGMSVFLADATKKVPKKQKEKYSLAGISFNSLFNFPEKTRKKWIAHARGLLEKNGVLLLIVYSDTPFSRKTIPQRIGFYKAEILPPNGFSTEFFDGKEKGIRVYDARRRERFFSRWVSRKELMREIRAWKGFSLASLEPLKCGIGWNVLLIKK